MTLAMAAARAEEALAIFRDLGHTAGVAERARACSRSLARAHGDDQAPPLPTRRALRLWTGLDDRWSIATGSRRRRGPVDGRRPHSSTGRASTTPGRSSGALSGLARIAAVHGRAEQAATLGAIDRCGRSVTPALAQRPDDGGRDGPRRPG